MAIAAPTQLGSTFSSNTSGQTTISSGAITFPTTGTDVLGIALIAVAGTSTSETITVSDGTNSWTVIAKADDTVGSAGGHTAVAYFPYPAAGGGTTKTITVTLSASVNERFAWFGYTTGHDTTTPVDQTGTNVGIGSTTSSSVSTSASSGNGSLGVFAYITGGATTGPGNYPSTGWTGLANPTDATRSRVGAFGYQIAGSAGVLTAGAFTNTASSLTPPVASIATFRAAGSGVPTISVAPAVTGTQTVGSTLTTTNGTWTGSPSSFARQWKRDVGTGGSTWQTIAGETGTTYTLTLLDIGSKVRCEVVATNGSGDSAAAASNQTSTIAAPAGITTRLIAGPIAQSDNQVHVNTTNKPVLAGELLVLFTGCSNANLIDGNGNKSDVGTVTDSVGLTWTEDSEAFSDTNIQHSGQVFSAQAPSGLAYNTTITMTVHGGTGAGGYHGQSPYWYVMAVNPGGLGTLALDQQAHQVDLLTTHASPSITTTNSNAIVFGFHTGGSMGSAGWWTPAAGFTEIADTDPALGSGGETDYGISGEYRVVTSGFTGTTGGTTASNKNLTNMAVAYSTADAGGPSYTSSPSGGFEVCGNMDVVFTPPVGGSPPSNTAAPVVSGGTTTGSSLSTTNGTWTNSPTGFTYQWQRDTAGNGTFANISGATASSYALTSSELTDNVRCVVTATNASGSASANSNAVGPVSAGTAGTPSKGGGRRFFGFN